jgi:hypothetical protein
MHAFAIIVVLIATSLGALDDVRAATIVDPMGDAVAVFGAPGPLIDIDTITVTPGGSQIQVFVTFHTPISPASSNAPNSLLGGLDFDFDRNALTGDPPFQNNFPQFAQLDFGSDRSVDFFSELSHPGFVDVFDNFTHTMVGTIPATFTATSVSYALPLSLTNANGPFYFTAGFGTPNQPTDALDVRGVVPEPATPLLLLLGIAMLLVVRSRRS